MLDHTKLRIWQRALAVSVDVDRALSERALNAPPGLLSQLSRSCASIASNIAEGAGQMSAPQTARFLDIAMASMSESQSHLARAESLNLIDPGVASACVREISELRRMTLSFRKWVLRSGRGNRRMDSLIDSIPSSPDLQFTQIGDVQVGNQEK